MKWEKLSHLEHVLQRPDSYVGATKPDTESCWVLDSNSTHFVKKNLTYPPALLKIFDEILVNALDQHAMHPTATSKIDVKICMGSGEISVTNNGMGIPIIIHETEKVYIPELIFGTLLTSSNYDDSEERTTGGRNGYGAKLTNIYSSKFSLSVKDPSGGKKMTWNWKDNMQSCVTGSPHTHTGGEGEVAVSFTPDWKRFGMSGMTEDVFKLFEKRVWDTAVCQSGNLKVTFQGVRIPVKKLIDYARMHDGVENAVTHVDPNGRWDVVVGSSNYSGFQHVSFVNGICTTRGGTHVDNVANSLSKDIISEFVKKKVDGAAKLKPMNIKAAMFMFVRSTLVNPTFSSQIKSECTSKSTEFGSTFSYPPKFIKAILDTGIRDELMSVARFKEQKDLKKSDGTKKNKISGIPKLDDANWAGTPKSDRCTLIITEGDSAKALAISGLSVVGRDMWGVFPLRGKPRNVRDASVKQLTLNQEFSDLKKILGLQQDKVYKNLSELRYGKLMIMTDADLDGSHIKGLVVNMIHCFWPSLITLGFIVSMVTPIIKVGARSFFTNQAYENWIRENGGLPRGAKVKYYKGLGTSTSTEAKEYFKKIDQLTVKFDDSPGTTKSVVLAFDKTRADARKQWLENYISNPLPEVKYGDVQNLKVDDFINLDMINFSIADVKRSIPHVCDGLKPSQRKVMFACMKRNLVSNEIKVAQLSGYISEVSAYHHGEASLQGTIIGMAHNYVGSNNINLLEPCGQFGTRLMGGKDAASSRYIFTKLSKDATRLFNPSDNSTLNFLDDDGKSIEPEYYMPILPVVLVNGADGIGTGYSTQVPCYNPVDIRANLDRCMAGEAPIPMTPWYKGFKGTIFKKDDHTWTMLGNYKTSQSGVITVTELPPGKWTQDYKEHLESLCDRGKIRSYDNHSTEDSPHFIIRGYDGLDIVKDLGLGKNVHTSNMWLMTPNGIKKYTCPEEIIVDFFGYRLEHYKKRKHNLLKDYKFQAELASNKARFVREVVNESFKIFKRKRADVETDLAHREFKKVQDSWDYLLNIKTVQYTEEAIAKLKEEEATKMNQYNELKGTKVLSLWQNDLKI
tara:strand:- start:1991 stop:5218 length:3228 start_codon:yes stop_codon:yes gene_type:complete